MELRDILGLRSTPGAGVFMQITMRCPLSCAHCCTDSHLAREEYDGSQFEALARTFTEGNAPDVLLLTGGEPMLRPGLVESLADLAHRANTRVALLSGMFFARGGKTPKAIERALDKLDHFTASLDVYHEAEVSRSDVFRVLEERLAKNRDVSLQITGLGPDDPYLIGLADDIRQRFGNQVPALFGAVGAQGRATDWVSLPTSIAQMSEKVAPCNMAAWPVVNCEGDVLACCNQGVIDGPAPSHLKLGRAGVTSWPAIRQKTEESEALRVIRSVGPATLASRLNQAQRCHGMCDACTKLSVDPSHTTILTDMISEPTFVVQEWMAAHKSTQRGYGIAEFEGMAQLSRRGGSECAA